MYPIEISFCYRLLCIHLGYPNLVAISVVYNTV